MNTTTRTTLIVLACAATAVVAAGCGPEAPKLHKAPETMSTQEPAVAMNAGQAFLAKNGQRAEVITTASGLQYEVLASGVGETPDADDHVTTHYHGTLINGEVFDSSVARGQPIEFPVNGVIRGWTEALQLMRVGDKWKLYIPPELAYGKRGAGASIGPDETLIFEVELLKVRRSG